SWKFTRTTVSVTLAVISTDSLARAVPRAAMVSLQGCGCTTVVVTATAAGGPLSAASWPQAARSRTSRRADRRGRIIGQDLPCFCGPHRRAGSRHGPGGGAKVRKGPILRPGPLPAPGSGPGNANAGTGPAFAGPRQQPISGSRLPAAEGGQAVVLGAGVHGLLGGLVVARHVLGPQLERRRLHGAAVAEAQRPGLGTHLVHGVEVGGGRLVALAAGQE